MDRFEVIEKRAGANLEDVRLAIRLGVSDGEGSAIFDEIAVKARDQGDLCATAINGLLIERVLPLIYARPITKAEKFATQCEEILDNFDAIDRAARRTFRSRFGLAKK